MESCEEKEIKKLVEWNVASKVGKIESKYIKYGWTYILTGIKQSVTINFKHPFLESLDIMMKQRSSAAFRYDGAIRF